MSEKDNSIGDEGAKVLSEMMKNNRSLTRINLWSENPENQAR